MSFRFRPDEGVGDALRRMGCEEIENAISLLSDAMNDPEKAVHDSRTAMKRTRCLLRMARRELGEERYRRDDALFREIARSLATVRDRAVIIQTLAALRERFPEEVTLSLTAPLHAYLPAGEESIRPDAIVVNRTVDMLREGMARVETWAIERSGFRAIRSGIRTTYGAARRRCVEAAEKPSVELLHSWRREVKYVWYMLRALKPIWPRMLNAMSADFRNLSELLGAGHDLALLRNIAVGEPSTSHILIDLIDRRREELRLESMALGGRLFIDRPDVFTSRLEACWQLWSTTA